MKRIFDNIKKALSGKSVYFFTVLLAFALVLSFGIFQYQKAQAYKTNLENNYRRAFEQLLECVNNIDTSLAKGLVIQNTRQLIALSGDIYRYAGEAKENLSQLPLSDVQMDNMTKFLSQVGDFAYTISLRSIDGEPITDEEIASIKELGKYSAVLADELANMQEELDAGSIVFSEVNKSSGAGMTALANAFEAVEKSFVDYPALVYDGPFSEHLEKMGAKTLEGGTQITQEQALERVKEILGDIKIEYIGETNGKIETYDFNAYPDENDPTRKIDMQITKINGLLILMLDNRSVDESILTVEDAMKKAYEFLEKHKFPKMCESYYEVQSNIATINFACLQDGVVVYPDLVKVRVAMDTGEVLGLEARGYIINHYERKNLRPKLTEDEARQRVSTALEIENIRPVIIPLESGSELLCYEFKGKLDDKTFLVYINADTGAEEEVLLLRESESGVLAI